MKKSKKANKTAKTTTKQNSKSQAHINKKVVIPIAVILVIILISTVVVYAFNSKNEKAGIQVSKTNANLENLEDNENMHVETDSTGNKVPVPNGYVGSDAEGENEIDTGYVIYEGEEAVTDSNVADAKKNRNQYVWVPVPDVSKFYGTDANGKKWGKLYSFTTGTNSSSLFDEETGTYPLNWSESNGVMTISSKTNYREPDYVKSYDYDSKLKTLGIGEEETHELSNQLEKEFNKMVESVEKYGGFYIGRYETGNLSKETPVVRKGNTDIKSVTWYNMYKRCKNLKGENQSVETGMIWGNEWDRTLMWLIESGDKTKEDICKDSTSWGNYSNATFTYENGSGTSTKNENSSTRIPTGSAEYTKANNIYDLAGNVYDWTMEAWYTYGRVFRGGSYYLTGTSRPSSNRSNYNLPTDSVSNLRLSCSTLYKVALGPGSDAAEQVSNKKTVEN